LKKELVCPFFACVYWDFHQIAKKIYFSNIFYVYIVDKRVFLLYNVISKKKKGIQSDNEQRNFYSTVSQKNAEQGVDSDTSRCHFRWLNVQLLGIHHYTDVYVHR
jgi:hypothetical protein